MTNYFGGAGRSGRIILGGFAVVILLMGLVAGVTVVHLQHLAALNEQIHFENSVHVQLAHRMYHAARDRSYQLVRLVHEPDLLVADEHAQRFWALAHDVAQARRELIAAGRLSEPEVALLEQQGIAINRTLPLQEQVVDLALSYRTEEAMRVLTNQVLPVQEGVLDALSAFIAFQKHEVEQANNEAREEVRWAVLTLSLGTAAAAVLSVLIAVFVQRNTGRLMHGLTDTTAQLRVSLRELAFQKQALDEHAIVSIADRGGRITYVNDRFCAVSQYRREELVGADHSIVNSGEHPHEFFSELWRTIAAGRVWHGDICNAKKDGSHYWVSTTILPVVDEQGRPDRYVSVRTDITAIKRAEAVLASNQARLEELVTLRTAELAEREAALQRLSETDMLTGVANRRKFDEALTSEISRAQRHDLPLTLLIMDIDHFKLLNDHYGHQTGDLVLIEFAHLVAGHIRAHDFFARWGGEEFTLLATHCTAEETHAFADKLRQLVAEHHFTVVGQVTVSVGLAGYQAGEDGDALLARADQALYAAKAGGRNRVAQG